ncbi:efflux RND transporter periplasmic adaptor subunit [Gemmatimonas aurantiaca]|nr:efflux RND transporter periplasmic adaptor subunit [Gemmatimonas aurantiaca]
MFKKIMLWSFVVVLVGASTFFFVRNGSANKEELKTIEAEIGSIIDKALAVGKIEPRQEISVKSKLSGIVKKIYAEVGDSISIGDPLFDIAPDPTPVELAVAKRQVEIYQVTYANSKKEANRLKSLSEKNLEPINKYEAAQARCDENKLRLSLATEKLALLESGKTIVAGKKVESIVRASIDGIVLSRLVDVGDPITPLSSFQEGTELMTLAWMKDLLFKGSVDEIDVGKLSVNMLVEISIGALPNDTVTGILTKISPKARQNEGSTVFDVEVELDPVSESTFLRAGYSATANIIIRSIKDIILVPERLLTMTDSITTIEIQDTLGQVRVEEVETGLSDGLNIEIVRGVSEGDLLVERPPKKIGDDEESEEDES